MYGYQCLNFYWFRDLTNARRIIEDQQVHYDKIRPVIAGFAHAHLRQIYQFIGDSTHSAPSVYLLIDRL